MRRAITVLLACMLALAACGEAATVDTDEPTPTPEEAPTPTPTPEEPPEDGPMAATQTCTNDDGFTVEFPEDWVTNTAPIDELPPCSVFDPESVEWEQGMTVPLSIGAFIRIDAVAFDDTGGPDGEFQDELSREELTIDGHDAVLLETEATGRGMHPEGTRTTSYRVDVGDGETLIATTHDVGDHDYETKQQVLDAMMETLEIDR